MFQGEKDLVAEKVETNYDISQIFRRKVTIYVLSCLQSQYKCNGSTLARGACLSCALNVCFYFDHRHMYPRDMEKYWVQFDANFAFKLDRPNWMQKSFNESNRAWFQRINEMNLVEAWQVRRGDWCGDAKFRELCCSPILSVVRQLEGCKRLRDEVNDGFYSVIDGLNSLARSICGFRKFDVVCEKKIESSEWDLVGLGRALENCVQYWFRAFCEWPRNHRKPFLTMIFIVEAVATAVVYDPETNVLMFWDSHPYKFRHGASVGYSVPTNIAGFLEHMFETSFYYENRDVNNDLINRKRRREEKQLFTQSISVVLSKTVVDMYKNSGSAIVEIKNIFGNFDD